jgi:hypothetical protein
MIQLLRTHNDGGFEPNSVVSSFVRARLVLECQGLSFGARANRRPSINLVRNQYTWEVACGRFVIDAN